MKFFPSKTDHLPLNKTNKLRRVHLTPLQSQQTADQTPVRPNKQEPQLLTETKDT